MISFSAGKPRIIWSASTPEMPTNVKVPKIWSFAFITSICFGWFASKISWLSYAPSVAYKIFIPRVLVQEGATGTPVPSQTFIVTDQGIFIVTSSGKYIRVG